MVFRHALDRLSCTEEGSCDINRKDSLNPFRTHTIDKGLNIQNASVINQSIRGGRTVIQLFERVLLPLSLLKHQPERRGHYPPLVSVLGPGFLRKSDRDGS